MPIQGSPSPQPATPCCRTADGALVVDTTGALSGVPAARCQQQFVLTPSTPTFDGKPLLGRMKTVEIKARRDATLSWTFTLSDGTPVDLSGCVCDNDSVSSSEVSESSSSSEVATECGYVVRARLREQLALGDPCGVLVGEILVTIETAATGRLSLSLNRNVTDRIGVFFVEIALVGEGTLDPDDPDSPVVEFVKLSNTFQLAITDGLWSATAGGPPTLGEIRLWLRDTSPAESRLLSGVQFGDDEILAAISRVVLEWNETPPMTRIYDTQSFPFRHMWILGACGYLYQIAAAGDRKNRLPYQAAGISVDDAGKADEYEKISQLRLQEYRRLFMHQKKQQNIAAGFGGVASPYRGIWQ